MRVPPQYQHTPVAKMFESGKIGGTHLVEHEVDTLEDAVDLWRRNRDKQSIEILRVPAPGQPRQRVRPEQLAPSEYFGDHEHTT